MTKHDWMDTSDFHTICQNVLKTRRCRGGGGDFFYLDIQCNDISMTCLLLYAREKLLTTAKQTPVHTSLYERFIYGIYFYSFSYFYLI